MKTKTFMTVKISNKLRNILLKHRVTNSQFESDIKLLMDQLTEEFIEYSFVYHYLKKQLNVDEMHLVVDYIEFLKNKK